MGGLPRFFTNLLPVAPHTFETMAAASHLGIHGTAAGLISAAAAAIFGIELAKGHDHERVTKEARAFAVRVVQQQEDWRKGLDELLIDHGIDLAGLPDKARHNPLARFALLLIGQDEEIKRMIGESQALQASLLRESLQALVGSLRQPDFESLSEMAGVTVPEKSVMVHVLSLHEKVDVTGCFKVTDVESDLAIDQADLVQAINFLIRLELIQCVDGGAAGPAIRLSPAGVKLARKMRSMVEA